MYILYKYFYKNPVKTEKYRTCKLIQSKITQFGQIIKKKNIQKMPIHDSEHAILHFE